jgi:hypothetical protein
MVARNQRRFTNSRGMFDEELPTMKMQTSGLFLLAYAAIGSTAEADALPLAVLSDHTFVTAQAMISQTAIGSTDRTVATANAAEERMNRRYPQPVRVGDLIGLPVLDDGERILGFVRQVVRTPQSQLKLIVSYNGLFGWLGLGHSVAVPIEAVGIFGRNIASLDMPRSEYANAPTWAGDGTALSNNDAIRVALAKH